MKQLKTSLNNLITINDLEKISNSKIISSFLYGSHVYGTASNRSDVDYIVVTESDPKVEEYNVTDTKERDFHFISKEKFLKGIELHEISYLECLYLPSSMKKSIEFDIPNIHKPKLRSSISAKALNSWVKAKKKLEVEQDYYIGKKSLWHSFRILTFGIQVAKYNRIVDFTSANYLYDEIVNCECNDWSYYKDKYKKLHNEKSSEFKLLTPMK